MLLSEVVAYNDLLSFAYGYLNIPKDKYISVRACKEGVYVHCNGMEYFISIFKIISSLCPQVRGYSSIEEELLYSGFTRLGETVTRCEGCYVKVIKYVHSSGAVAYTVGSTLPDKVLYCKLVIHSITVSKDYGKICKEVGGEIKSKYYLSVLLEEGIQNIMMSLLIANSSNVWLPVEVSASPRGIINIKGQYMGYEESFSDLFKCKWGCEKVG